MSLELIDFSATWCGPCRMQKPIIEELKTKYAKVNFRIVDIDESPDMARTYNIHAVPTLVVLKDGKEVSRFVGVSSKEKLETEIGKYL
ncbi:thioredoxin family protein [Methanolapillus millepedarum]|uniref:Thioredoxin n=1 Tax=Methanolapillus millepedarum TaxID=3028296 RepID=A0AA96VET2_9EURY|nr:Thioredoxin [Methanosarcinaceae archaeon Ac7]